MKKSLILLIAVAACAAMVLAACHKEAPESSSNSEESSTSTESSEISSEPTSEPSSQEESSVQGGQVIIYNPDEDTASATSIDTDGQSLDEALIAALNETYAVEDYTISVNEILHDGNGITIDFTEQSIPLAGLGSSEESACLRSIGETFFQNYPEAELIYFTVDGSPYISGHLELAEGEPYMDRSMTEKS